MNNKPIFEMLVGVAGSGKSTYAKSRKEEFDSLEEPCAIVSSDAIRGELWGNESDQREPERVFAVMLKRTRNYLFQGVHVIYDACNFQEKYRKEILRAISNINCHRNCTVFIETPEVCVARQELRDRKVPEYVIQRQIRQFQIPHESEGWDDIKFYCHPYSEEKFYEVINKAKSFNQKNPHHKHTLGEHMGHAYGYATNKDYKDVVAFAAGVHDIGKIYTQTFDKDGVAHYYNHENVGAYLYFLLTGDVSREGQIIAWLVNHHMDFFKGEKYLNKLKKQINNDVLYTWLEQVHECDVNTR